MVENIGELLRKRMRDALKGRGEVAKFCRDTNFARNTVESWLKGISSPNVRNLPEIASALGYGQPWRLIQPDSTRPIGDPFIEEISERTADFTDPEKEYFLNAIDSILRLRSAPAQKSHKPKNKA